MDDIIIQDGKLYLKVKGKGVINFGENYIKLNENNEFESVTKTIDFDSLPSGGKDLFQDYCKELNISEELGKEIIRKNQSAISFIQDYPYIKYIKHDLKLLIKLTLFRDELGELNAEDKIILKEYYNIGDD